MRAHYRGPVQDLAGNLLPGAVVSVCVNGTNGQTLLSQPIFSDNGATTNTLSNPFTTLDGNVSFYLSSATRVDLLILPPGGVSVLFPDIDVNLPATVTSSFTFPGSGPSSTQLGNNSTATQSQAVAFGDTSLASGAQATAVGQGAQATNNGATVLGQGATATGQNSTTVGQTSDATAANATALGQNAQASGSQSTAIGSNSAAAATHSTAVGAGANANVANTVVIGTLADDIFLAGGFQLSQSSSPQVLVNSSTITFTGPADVLVTAASAVTGLILASNGPAPGQIFTISNESGFSLTFAAVGTSNVADGTADIIPPLSARTYIWDANTSLWYPDGIQWLVSPWLPADNNLLAASGDPDAFVNQTATLTAGAIYLSKVQVRMSMTVGHVCWLVATGATGASSGTFTGLYSSAGTLLSGSADIGSSLTTSLTSVSLALTTPQALTPGTFVWAALLVNFATTQPALYRNGGAGTLAQSNAFLTAANWRYATNSSGLVALPASITPASNVSTNAAPIWAGLAV